MTLLSTIAIRTDPRRRGGDILYLDLDGVLHPDEVYRSRRIGIHLLKELTDAGYALFENAGLLIELLRPYPDVKIVLSTSWVRVLGYSQTRRYLPAELDARVVGATFHSAMDKPTFEVIPRGVQVTDDVYRRRPNRWLAIDDDLYGWPPGSLDHIVFSHPRLGISDPEVLSLLRQRLAENFGTSEDDLPPSS